MYQNVLDIGLKEIRMTGEQYFHTKLKFLDRLITTTTNYRS